MSKCGTPASGAKITRRFSAPISASKRRCGSAGASPATTRTATSTTWLASSARTVVVAQESDESDENFVPLRENLERLRGYKLEVVPLPMPRPVMCDGQRLPASYANFYIATRHVLVPTFNDPNDYVALGVLRELFPGRTVVGIHAVDLVFGLGTLHCMTQQQPA